MQGIIKPDIVFFGEQLPAKFWMYEEDFLWADLLIIMGTSLEVGVTIQNDVQISSHKLADIMVKVVVTNLALPGSLL